jgi:hypothetical protein
MPTIATGTFVVKLTPKTPDEPAEESSVGRRLIDKQFFGDLEGSSKGQMLSFLSEVKGSAGYVAMERVNGTLQGRSGAFALQHSGSMNRGIQQLSVTVVPDSGTGELIGLSGQMSIDIADGKHSYTFEYSVGG